MEKSQQKQKKNRVKMFEKLQQREKTINSLKEQELQVQCLTSLKLLKTKIQKNQENFLKYIKDLQNPKSKNYIKKYSAVPLHQSILKFQEKFESLQQDKFLRKSQEDTAVVEEEFFDLMIQKKIKEKSYMKLQIEKIKDNFQRQITLKTCNFNLQSQQSITVKVFYKLDQEWQETSIDILPSKSLLELKLKSLKQIKNNLSFQQQIDIGFPIDYKIKQYDASFEIKLSNNLVQTFFDVKESLDISMLEQKAIVLIRKSEEEKNIANQELDLAQMKQIIDPLDEKVVLKLECESLNIKNFFLAINKEAQLKEILANFAHQEQNFQPTKYRIYQKILIQNYYSFEVRFRELSSKVKAKNLSQYDLSVKKLQYLDKPSTQHFDQKRISFFFSEKFSKNFNNNKKICQYEDQSIYPISFDIRLLVSNKFIPKKLEINKDYIQIYDQRLFSFLGQQTKFNISDIRKIQLKINDTMIITYVYNNIKKNLILKSKRVNQIKGILNKNENLIKQLIFNNSIKLIIIQFVVKYYGKFIKCFIYLNDSKHGFSAHQKVFFFESTNYEIIFYLLLHFDYFLQINLKVSLIQYLIFLSYLFFMEVTQIKNLKIFTGNFFAFFIFQKINLQYFLRFKLQQ